MAKNLAIGMLPVLLIVLSMTLPLPAASMSFRFIGADGNPMYVRPGGFWVSDLNHKPVAYAASFSNGLVTFNSLPDKPLLCIAYLEVPGYGNLNFTAANGGSGFVPQGQTLDVFYEAAHHRYLAANSVWQQALTEGYTFTSDVSTQMASALTYLTQAQNAAPGSKNRSLYSQQSLQYSGPASESIVVQRGRQKLDRQGGLRPNQLVSTFAYYEAREGQPWRDTMNPLFNSGVEYIPWQVCTQPNGTYNWSVGGYNLDGTIQRLRQMGKKIRIQPGMWLNWLPSWYPAHPTVEQLRTTLVNFTRAAAQHYPDVRYWQAISEASGSWDNLGYLTPEDIVSLSTSVCHAVKDVNPLALVGVNSTLMWGENTAQNLNANPRVISPYEYYEMLDAAGAPYDLIVMQLYFTGQDIFEVDQILEVYKRFGKKIGIESQCASAMGPMAPDGQQFPNGHPGQLYFQWHRNWDSQLQADWLEEMFIVCLSKDYVYEWNWWDTAEYVDCYYPWGGVYDVGYQMKPSGQRLRDLISRWGRPAFSSCTVSDNDLASFAADWLGGSGLCGDFNHDNQVNFRDFEVLAEYWLNSCPDDWPWGDLGTVFPVGTAWRLFNDYSSGSNPASAWSYHDAGTGNLLMRDPNPIGFVGMPGWSIDGLSTGNSVPAFWKGPTAIDATIVGPEDMGAHGPIQIRWTSPANLTVDISGYMYQDRRIQPPVRIMQWSLSKNGTVLTQGTVSTSNIAYDFVSGSGGATVLRQNVLTGDVLDLKIFGNAPGSQESYSTFVGFKETITIAP